MINTNINSNNDINYLQQKIIILEDEILLKNESIEEYRKKSEEHDNKPKFTKFIEQVQDQHNKMQER